MLASKGHDLGPGLENPVMNGLVTAAAKPAAKLTRIASTTGFPFGGLRVMHAWRAVAGLQEGPGTSTGALDFGVSDDEIRLVIDDSVIIASSPAKGCDRTFLTGEYDDKAGRRLPGGGRLDHRLYEVNGDDFPQGVTSIGYLTHHFDGDFGRRMIGGRYGLVALDGVPPRCHPRLGGAATMIQRLDERPDHTLLCASNWTVEED